MIGTRIAALRRQCGLSQAELARRIQVSPSAVGMYEQGRREPSAELLVAMAREFGVSTDFLLTGKPVNETDHTLFSNALLQSLDAAQAMTATRRDRPFSRQELAVLMAAMLMEP
jgi:transcriptional regulator with XRE-family HTH domain